MSDPLSVLSAAASFVGLAGQAAQGISYIRQVFKDIKGAPRLIKNLNHELQVLESTLFQLSTINPAHISPEAARNFTETVEHCFTHAEALSNILSKYEFSRIDGSAKKLWKQVVASDKRSDLEEHTKRLERAKSSLTTALGGLQIQMTEYVPNTF